MKSEILEKVIRANLRKYQRLYDACPAPLQNILITLRGYFLTRLRYQKLFWDTLAEILPHDRFTDKELRAYQNQRLRRLMWYAYENIPFYRDTMLRLDLSPDQIQSVEDLQQLPVLTRADVKNHFPELLVDRDTDRIVVHTSGSSGSGIPVAYNKNDLARNWAFMFRQFIWAGVEPKEWRITLFGSKVVPEAQSKPPYWRYNFLERQILLSIFHLSEKTKEAYLEFLESHRGQVLEGFASVLGIIADFVLQEGKTIPMKMVYSTGEPMDGLSRRKVESAFDCKLYDCYGMTEWAGLIQECEMGGRHLLSDFGILEILDEHGRPVAPGEEGYLVWTGLQKEEMPFIRYKIGDKGMLNLQQICECGRPYPLVDATITRDSDILTTPTGQYFSPRVLNQFLKDKVAFNSCQFIQESADRVVVRIVPGAGEVQQQAQLLVQDLYNTFNGSLKLDIRFAEKPLMRGNGKFPLIINQVNQN